MKNNDTITIYSRYRTLPDGTRRYAHQDGLEAYRFEIPLEKHQAYIKKREQKRKKKES